MSEPMDGFARAWIKGSLGFSDSALRARLNAIRSIEAAMPWLDPAGVEEASEYRKETDVRVEAGVGGLGIKVLDEAAAFATGAFGTRARSVLQEIGRVAAFLDANGMTSLPIGGWSPPVRAPRRAPARSEAGFEGKAAKRLPSDAFLGHWRRRTASQSS